MISPFGVRVFK